VNAYEDGWAALADPTRRTIFARLAAAPMAVGELAETLPVTRPAVSQHLKVLKDAGLLADERAGTRRIYRVEPTGLLRMRAELDTFWNDALRAYKRVLEEPDADVARLPDPRPGDST
jgi:DNA-binding transcriptional ArsR family regulator